LQNKALQPPLTIREMILPNVKTEGAIAIEDIWGRKTSYKELYDQISDVVGVFNGAGFRRNDRIAMALPSGPEMAVAVIALTCGFTTIPLNPSQTLLEYGRILPEVNAKAMIVEKGSESLAGKAAKDQGMELMELVISKGDRSGIFSLASFDTRTTIEPEFACPEDVANVILTSGTTAKPKLVPWTHSMIYWGNYFSNLNSGLISSDRLLTFNPLFHAAGLTNIYRALYCGGTVICPPAFQASEFFRWFDITKPTVYGATPVMQQSILEMVDGNVEIILRSRLRFIRVGTASLPSKTLKELEGIFGVLVVETYASTEVIGIGSSSFSLEHKPGVLIPVIPELRIIDHTGKLVPQGELGEIAVKGPNVFKGYENDPEANKAAFVDGWFRTGDLGYLDEEGYLHLGGRVKEVINKGGEKVAPQDVEEALMEHQAVAEAVAFPVPHPTLGEDVVAAVVLKKGQYVGEKDLRSFLFDRLAYFKVPTRIVFVESIPKGATRKVNRLDMAQTLGLL
jgi:acyl-CoA synthetase (AMP-forming)/AMP-acid ligase II